MGSKGSKQKYTVTLGKPLLQKAKELPEARAEGPKTKEKLKPTTELPGENSDSDPQISVAPERGERAGQLEVYMEAPPESEPEEQEVSSEEENQLLLSPVTGEVPEQAEVGTAEENSSATLL